MQTKHTPGEWKIYDLKHAYHINAGYTHIASLTCIDMPQANANAKLIAAAPDLLELANQIVLTEGAGEAVPLDILQAAKAVIKKATD